MKGVKKFFKKRRSKQQGEAFGEGDKVEYGAASNGDVIPSANEQIREDGKNVEESSPKKASEPKRGTNTNFSAEQSERPEKKGNLLKWLDDDKSVASSTISEGAEKRSNGASSPVKDKVDEVVVPQSSIEDRHSTISRAYDSIPLLEQTKLPRGGVSIETEAVGRVQVSIMCP